MDKVVKKSLKKITKGALIILMGFVLANIFAFFTRIIIVRNIPQEDFGIFSLVIVIIGITSSLAALGLQTGVTRYVAYYRARKDSQSILCVIISALQMAIFGGLLFFAITFFGAPLLANLFGNPDLIFPLRIYSIAIPFLLLASIFIAVYRGFERADIKVVFNEVMRSGLILLGLGIVAIFGFSLNRIIYAYLAASILVFVALGIYSKKGFYRLFKKHKFISMKKTLLLFSLPILLITFLDKFIAWSDVLILGYFKEEAIVGMYNAAFPLAKYITLVSKATVFLYVPLATALYASNQHAALRRNYAVLTKWMFTISLPIFGVIFLFPSVILDFLYGADYAAASIVLSILAAGFAFHTLIGPSGATLTALGKTKFLMFTTMTAATLNFILNLFLIPTMGITGAAIASAAAMIATNIINSIKLYFLIGIHPFRKNYLKPIILTATLILIAYYTASQTFTVKWWILPIIFIFFIAAYLFALIITRSFDKEDIMMLLVLERKMGLNLSFIKNILKKFI